MESQSNLMKAAIFYHNRGWQVMPLKPNSKVPAFHEWSYLQERKQTTDEVERAFTNQPEGTNIAILTGAISKLTVVDIDVKDPVTKEIHDNLKAKADRIVDQLPATLTSQTPTGGYHLFYQESELPNSVGLIHPQIDIRSHGGYVVAAPSVINETKYKWLTALTSSPAPLPEDIKKAWFIRTNHPALKQKEWIRTLKGVGQGGRNMALAKLVGKLLITFITSKETFKEDLVVVYQLVKAWNKLNNPPIDNTELEKTFNSIVSRHYGRLKNR